jgi:hypothetical protein
MLLSNPPPPTAARRRTSSRTVAPDSPPPAAFHGATGTRGYLGPATVLDVNEAKRLVRVEWEHAGRTVSGWARPALASPSGFRRGDVALAMTQDAEDIYLVGILESAAEKAVPPAAPAKSSDADVVQVRSKDGDLVVEYHPASGRTVVNVENGDLEFVTRNGSISFHAAQTISLVAHRLETDVDTVVSKAGNVYETVKELAQLEAGRTRTLVEESCLLKARDAFLCAEGDFKVDGAQIHLG